MTEDVISDQIETTPSLPLDYERLYIEQQKELNALRSKSQELLDETKKAKRRAEDEALQKAQAQEESFKKKGEYEQLYKSANEKATMLEEKLKAKDAEKAREIAKSEAIKLASQLADGHNSELLSEFIKPRIKVTDEGVKVLDIHGNLTVSSLEDLKNEFATSDKYKSLLRGSKATGGGAVGSGGGATSASLVDLATFNSWDAKRKMHYMLNVKEFKK